jgi:small subunit ribosomal protein S17
MTQKPRKTVLGTVASDRMQKTIVVRVERLVRHPRFGKYIRKSTTYYAHDEKNEARMGDEVRIIATRPLSRLKRWRLVEVVKRAPGPLRHEDAQA